MGHQTANKPHPSPPTHESSLRPLRLYSPPSTTILFPPWLYIFTLYVIYSCCLLFLFYSGTVGAENLDDELKSYTEPQNKMVYFEQGLMQSCSSRVWTKKAKEFVSKYTFKKPLKPQLVSNCESCKAAPDSKHEKLALSMSRKGFFK